MTSAASIDATGYYVAEESSHEEGGATLFGFWIYLMSDCLLFAALFATFGVLSSSYAGGPGPRDLFELPIVALNTAMLLLSSVTYGFAVLSLQQRKVNATILWLAVTGLFGAAFVGIELNEFANLASIGATPQRSAFLSAFYALVSTHGLHVTFGIVWLLVLIVQLARRGLIAANVRRVMCLSMFWHFLDVVWIGVFTFVYLMGVVR